MKRSTKITTKTLSKDKVLNKKANTSLKKTRKTREKTYQLVVDGGYPYIAIVSPTHIEIYNQIWQEDNTYTRGKRVIHTPYQKLFIGDNDLHIEYGMAPKGMYRGNSLLIQLGTGKYIYAGGAAIYTFQTRNGEEIKKYYSPVGNSAVAYPYAVGENYTYFMLDKQTLPNHILDLKDDGYPQFYGYIEDDERKRIIESSKQGFRTKKIL